MTNRSGSGDGDAGRRLGRTAPSDVGHRPLRVGERRRIVSRSGLEPR